MILICVIEKTKMLVKNQNGHIAMINIIKKNIRAKNLGIIGHENPSKKCLVMMDAWKK